VITHRGRDADGAEASVSGGSLGSYNGRFSYGANFSNGVELVVSGSYYHSDGNSQLFYREFDTPANNNGKKKPGSDALVVTHFAYLLRRRGER
jgi:outer membrane receptor for ferrienterochelin and colicins